MPIAPERPWLTTGEAAELVGVHRDTITRWVREGRLTAHRWGGAGAWQRISRADLERLMSGDDPS